VSPARSTVVTTPQIDLQSNVFALRLANLLRATRDERRLSVRAVMRASGGRLTRHQVKQLERGDLPLDDQTLTEAGVAYQVDLGRVLPPRQPVVISDGSITAAGVRTRFVPSNPTSLLTAYLRLIRTMRNQKKSPAIALRREDIDALATYLHEPGEAVVERLTALMGATVAQRTAMASMFAAGAIVIGLAGGALLQPSAAEATAAPATTITTSATAPTTALTTDGASTVRIETDKNDLDAAQRVDQAQPEVTLESAAAEATRAAIARVARQDRDAAVERIYAAANSSIATRTAKLYARTDRAMTAAARALGAEVVGPAADQRLAARRKELYAVADTASRQLVADIYAKADARRDAAIGRIDAREARALGKIRA
jgi:hypothetical protein